MTQLLEKLEKLNAARRQSVEDFADRLLDEQAAEGPATSGQRKVSFDGWAGCLEHVDPSKSDKELVREAWAALTDKHMKD